MTERSIFMQLSSVQCLLSIDLGLTDQRLGSQPSRRPLRLFKNVCGRQSLVGTTMRSLMSQFCSVRDYLESTFLDRALLAMIDIQPPGRYILAVGDPVVVASESVLNGDSEDTYQNLVTGFVLLRVIP